MAPALSEQQTSAPLTPWSSVVCSIYSALAAILIPLSLHYGGIAPRWGLPDPEETWHARSAMLLCMSAMMTEMLLLMSSSGDVMQMGWSGASELRSHRLGDSMLTLSSYSLKVSCGIFLWWSTGGIVHQDSMAYGGPRPVYTVRFLQWSLCVPLLIALGNRPFLETYSFREKLTRCAPALVASFLYVWAAWVMEVSESWGVRWFMMFFSFLGSFLVCADQFVLCYHHRHDVLAKLKTGLVLYSVMTFAFYGLFFLLGRFGVISSLVEQLFYTYGDATLKVLQGPMLAMVRNRQDVDTVRRLWLASTSASLDLQNMINGAKAPVFALDLEGRITQWNANLHALTGFSYDDVRGKLLTELVVSASKETLELTLRKTLARARGETTEEIARTGDAGSNSALIEISIVCATAEDAKPGSTVRQLAMAFVPKSTPEGEVAGIMAIGQDLSEVATLKLVQDQKTALLAMLSHEIRSPLHGMMGLTTALLDTEAGKGMNRQLGMIRGCAARLLDLVTNVMDLAQHEKRKQAGCPIPRPSAPVNIGDIADEVVLMLNAAVDKVNKPLVRPSVRLVNEITGMKLPLIPGDPYKCTQMIYNLVTNACKFTITGSVTISAKYVVEEHKVEVMVIDTGKGISDEGQKRIFQPFTQEQNGDARSFQGIGLGLAVCAEVAELHDGVIRVESELGVGSTFIVSLFADGSLGWC
eukprot:CAMPEP_0203954084 /NCGR_PEP_ID=MMETSP0359-20131031/87270_1 /ASSEMBLY_ACC=CAM_ASM_000338 /TAXON_ID=268821 /ORGANISM="Scrippsiella Hangoei, Strain SHTV-5" /LENGTH=697 /DNA_ID=CAMNT_0050887593 /DNA_START=43 /DNA_END=2133 /DNA_ORIENTATION=-